MRKAAATQFWCLPERLLSRMMTPRDRATTTRRGGLLAVLDETGAVTPTVRTQSFLGRWRLSPLVAVLAAILLILILPPTLYLVVTSFFSTKPDGSFDQFTLRFYQQLFSSPYFAASLGNTVHLRVRLGAGRDCARRGAGADRRAHQYARPPLRLSWCHRVARHSACALYGGVASAARPHRAGEHTDCAS